MRQLVSLVLLLAVSQSSPAQIVVQSGFGFSFGGPRYRVSGFSGQTRAIVGGPGYFVPVYRPWCYYAPTPVIVVVPQPIFEVPQYNLAGFLEPALAPKPEPPANPARWQVIKPNAPRIPPVPKPDLVPAAPVAALADRRPNPVRESARQVQLARAAFTAGEFGRAAERLTQAILAKPDEPLPYFLLSQVRVARGEYVEAVAAIRDGLQIAPDWPASLYSARSLYGADVDLFESHLKELRQAVERNPEDVMLKYLLAYQFWFSGERLTATAFFRQLEPRVKDKAMIEAFLNVAVGRVVER